MNEAFGDSDKKNKMESCDVTIIRSMAEEGSCIDSKVMEVLLIKRWHLGWICTSGRSSHVKRLRKRSKTSVILRKRVTDMNKSQSKNIRISKRKDNGDSMFEHCEQRLHKYSHLNRQVRARRQRLALRSYCKWKPFLGWTETTARSGHAASL